MSSLSWSLLTACVAEERPAAVEEGTGRGGDRGCGDREARQSVGWNDATILGITPEQAFRTASSRCESTLAWDARGFGAETIEPGQGETPVTVEVTVDPASARVVGLNPAPREDGCEAHLEADATLLLTTASGTFEVRAPTRVSYVSDHGLSVAGVDASLPEGAPGLRVKLAPRESASIGIELDDVAASCAGEIYLSTTRPGPDGSTEGGAGVIARWGDGTN